MSKRLTKMNLVVALLFAAVIAPRAHAGNIITNPGFETGSLAPWTNARNFCGGTCVNWFVTSSDSHSGMFSAEDTGNIELKETFAGVLVSDITSITWWTKHPNAGASAEAFDFFYTDGTDDEFIVSTTTTNWEQENGTAFLAAGKTLDGFSIFGNSAGITFVDDVDIQAGVTSTPEPSSLLLFGTSLLGLAPFRRKLFGR